MVAKRNEWGILRQSRRLLWTSSDLRHKRASEAILGRPSRGRWLRRARKLHLVACTRYTGSGHAQPEPERSADDWLGNAIFDQRHPFVLSGVYVAPYGFTVGGLATVTNQLPARELQFSAQIEF
jgi:hypothetical protein